MLSANLKPLNSTWSALSWGLLLTDDYYGDTVDHIYWHGRRLSVPDLAVGRLVETPEEIRNTVVDYYKVGKNGFQPETSLVTGYDFLTDSAHATNNVMGTLGLTPSTLLGETWTATSLKKAWTQSATRQDLVSLNAHFEHWNAIPPDESDGLFYTTDISGAIQPPIRTVIWSVGCHSGYSVHDAHSASSTTALDFAQAFAWKRTGGFVGNTGYGLGDTTEIGYSERLSLYFAQELGSRANMPVGVALIRAKQRYAGSAPSGGFSVYDEKALIEATLYGLPMYRVTVPAPEPARSAGTAGTNMVTSRSFSAGQGEQIDYAFSFQFVPHIVPGWGTYYTADSYADTQTNAGRPIQPLVLSDVTRADTTAHGVVLMYAQGTLETPFDPVITAIVTDTSNVEPEFTYDGCCRRFYDS